MKTVLNLRKVAYLFMLLCSVFYFSCSNNWLSVDESIETFDLLDASTDAVTINGPGGSYFPGTNSYRFQAVPPVGYTMTDLTWSVSGVGTLVSTTGNYANILFSSIGHADIMISCRLTSGNYTRDHVQVLTVKVITRSPVLSIDKNIQFTAGSTYRASATYSPAIGSVTYEWSVPANVSYTSTIADRSIVNLTYPTNGTYRIGVRAIDGDQYSDWIYETVTVSGDMSLVPLTIEFDNSGSTTTVTVVLSHNDYPHSSGTYYENQVQILPDRSFRLEEIMLVRGNYTLELTHDSYTYWDYKTYQLTITNDNGYLYGEITGGTGVWRNVEYCEGNTCVKL